MKVHGINKLFTSLIMVYLTVFFCFVFLTEVVHLLLNFNANQNSRETYKNTLYSHNEKEIESNCMTDKN